MGAGMAALAITMQPGAGFVGVMNATDHADLMQAYAKANVTAVALDWIPRISRVQR